MNKEEFAAVIGLPLIDASEESGGDVVILTFTNGVKRHRIRFGITCGDTSSDWPYFFCYEDK